VLADGGAYAKRHTIYIGKDGKVLYVDTEVQVKTAGPPLIRWSSRNQERRPCSVFV
jgi:hypothetical protein